MYLGLFVKQFYGVGARRMSIVGAKKKKCGRNCGRGKKPPTDVEIKMWAL